MKNGSVNDKVNKRVDNGAVKVKRGEGGIAFSLFMLLYFVVSLLVQGILLMVGAGQGSPLFNIVPPVVTYITCFAFLVVSGKKRNENVLSFCRIRKFSPYFAILAVTTATGLLFGLGFVNGLVAELLEKAGLKAQTVSLNFNGAWLFVAYVFSLAILPAVVEETAFRGVIFGENLKCGTAFAVIFSSLCFALYHCSLTQLLYQFLCGAVFCLLAYYSGSAIPSAIAHFTNNFCVLIFSYLGLDGKIDFYSAPVIALGLAVLAVSVGLTVFSGKKFRTASDEFSDGFSERDKDCDKKQERKYFFLFSSAGFVLCLAVLVTGLLT